MQVTYFERSQRWPRSSPLLGLAPLLASPACAVAPAMSSLPRLCKHARARGPCAASHDRLPPRTGAQLASPLLPCRVLDACPRPAHALAGLAVGSHAASRAVVAARHTRMHTHCAGGPGSFASPSRLVVPHSRCAPSIATCDTVSVDLPRLSAHENTSTVAGKGPSPGRELGTASPFTVSPPTALRGRRGEHRLLR